MSRLINISWDAEFATARGVDLIDPNGVIGFLSGSSKNDDNAQQTANIARQLEKTARAQIITRTNRGMMMGNTAGGGSLVKIPQYSRRRVSIPTTRTSGEERSPRARSLFQQAMSTVRSRMNSFGTLAARSTEAAVGTGANSRAASKKGKRTWVTAPNGYAHIRAMAGKGPPNLAFTGKMMSDLSTRVTIKKNKKAASIFSTMLSSRFRRHFSSGRRKGLSGKFEAGDGLPLYNIGIEFGFTTQRSEQLARWITFGTSGGRAGFRQARPFVGFASHELREWTREAHRIFAAGGNDTRFPAPVKDQPAPAQVDQPHNGRGSFIPFRY